MPLPTPDRCMQRPNRTLLNKNRLTRADWVLMAAFLLAFFFLFYHWDILGVGWDALNYLFSNPLDFYENTKKIRGGGVNMHGTPYPPTIYILFALWLLPFKVLGFIESPLHLPGYYAYWLKTLTTLVYFGSGYVFYSISMFYFTSQEHAKYATMAWLVMPLAIFSQFIFSQYDIFYVILTLFGVLFILRGNLFAASVCFGVAITFKYFPAFVFLPLLLLVEKRILKLFFCILLFSLPTLGIDFFYGNSPAYIEGVKGHSAIDRIFSASLDIGGWKVYFLFAAFSILCGVAYFYDVAQNMRAKVTAYFWLVSSILPFLFIVWHPQWLMFFAPAIVLTSLIGYKPNRYFLLDLFGMLFFVAVTSLAFQNNVDLAMLRGDILGIEYEGSYLMSQVFDIFKDHSRNVFLSGFWAYLVMQIILKYKDTFIDIVEIEEIDYGNVRRAFLIGLSIFLLPAMYAIYKDQRSAEVSSLKSGVVHGELLSNSSFEQSFRSKGCQIKELALLLGTFARKNEGKFCLEILDSKNNKIYEYLGNIADIADNAWLSLKTNNLKVTRGDIYKIKLTSPTGSPGNSITWWASSGDVFSGGNAIVNGQSKDSDFAFRIRFER